MDLQTRQAIASLVSQLTELQDKVARVERAAGTPQLPNSSLTGGAIRVLDGDGTDRGSIGWQADGTVAVVAKNGPPPPKPSTPSVAAGQLSLTVAWDGLFAIGDDGDPATQPLDFDHVQVHLSTTAGYIPDASTLQGSLFKPGSVVVTPLSDESTYYAVLVPVNTSGIPGEASDPTAGTPDPVVSGEVLDGSITTLKLADEAVTQAKIAAAAVGTTQIADDSITTPKVVAGAIQTEQIDAGAVNAGNLAAGAVTTAKLDALAVTSDKIAANAITAGKINAGAVTAGTIAAGAVTANTLEATMVMATEMQSTDYTAGTAGWKIDGTGTAEFNDADFRGDVLIGPSGQPQIHISSVGGGGRIEVLSNDAIEQDPAHISSGVFGSGTSTVIQTNYFGARTNSTGRRPVIVTSSETASGDHEAYISLGTADSSNNFQRVLSASPSGVIVGASRDVMTLNTSPTGAPDGNWHTFANTTWSRSFPYTRTCPASETIVCELYFRGRNLNSPNATIALSVQIKAGSTVLWQPADGDVDSAAAAQNQSSTPSGTPDWRAEKTLLIGADILGGRAGQTITITPMYRLTASSSGTSYTYGAASLTVYDSPNSGASNVFS